MKISDMIAGREKVWKVLLYGDSGTGKTTSALTFPKPYIFDFDAGIPFRYASALKAGTVKGKTYGRADWPKFMQDFRNFNVEHVETVILDSLTTVASAVEYHVKKLNGSLDRPTQLQEWLIIMDRLENLIADIVEKSYNVVVTAHIQRFQDEQTGVVTILPLLPGKKLPPRLPLWFDEVYRCIATTTTEGKTKYSWQVQPDRLTMAKSRLGIQTKMVEPPTFQTLVKLLGGSQNELEATSHTNGAATSKGS